MWGLEGATTSVFHFSVAPQMPCPPVVTRIIPYRSCGDRELGAPPLQTGSQLLDSGVGQGRVAALGMGPRRDIWECHPTQAPSGHIEGTRGCREPVSPWGG